jgi:hypothetical protein
MVISENSILRAQRKLENCQRESLRTHYNASLYSCFGPWAANN